MRTIDASAPPTPVVPPRGDRRRTLLDDATEGILFTSGPCRAWLWDRQAEDAPTPLRPVTSKLVERLLVLGLLRRKGAPALHGGGERLVPVVPVRPVPWVSGGRGWKSAAACARVARPDLFFDDEVTMRSPERREARLRTARTVCRVCPVARQCLASAVLGDERDGIWGGVRFTKDGPAPGHAPTF